MEYLPYMDDGLVGKPDEVMASIQAAIAQDMKAEKPVIVKKEQEKREKNVQETPMQPKICMQHTQTFPLSPYKIIIVLKYVRSCTLPTTSSLKEIILLLSPKSKR